MALILNGDNGIVYNNLNQDIRSLLMPKNWIINGMFDVWQRGTSKVCAVDDQTLLADRFATFIQTSSTSTASRQAFTIGQTDVPNNPTYFSRNVIISGNQISSRAMSSQKIEDVTKLAGKTITISFWAKADTSKSMSIHLYQYFGIGGSTTLTDIGVQKFNLTTSWQRFTKTIILPSISGKIIGSGSYTTLDFYFDAGSNYNSRTNSLGNQSGTFDIANVSLVEGSVAVECQNQPYADVLRECRNYYRRYGANSGNVSSIYNVYGHGLTPNTTTANVSIMLESPMRTTPTSVEFGNVAINDSSNVVLSISSLSIDVATTSQTVLTLTCTVSGVTSGRYCRLINNNSSGYIGISAEL